MGSPTVQRRPRGWRPGHPVRIVPIEVGPLYKNPDVEITEGESWLRCGCGWSATVANDRAAEVAELHRALRA